MNWRRHARYLRTTIAVCLAVAEAPGCNIARAQDTDLAAAQSKVLELNLNGKFQEALEQARQMLAMSERTRGAESTEAAGAHFSIAVQLQSLGRLPDAEQHYRRGLAIQQRLVPAGDLSLAIFVSGLGGLLYGQGRYDEAEPYMRKSLDLQEVLARQSGNETGMAVALFMVGSNYTSMDRLEEGRNFLERSLATFERLMPQGGVQTAIVLNNLGNNRQRANDLAGAIDYQTRSLHMFERFSPENLPGIAKIHNNLGYLSEQQGRIDPAMEHHRQAIALFARAYPSGHPDAATSFVNYGRLMIGRGRVAEAEKLLSDGLALRQKWLPPDHADIALAHAELADLWIRASDWKRAVLAQLKAADIFVKRAARQGVGRRGNSRDDVAANAFAFAKLVKAQYRLDRARLHDAFIAAQRARESSAATSLAQMATRSAKGDPVLSGLVRTRQDAAGEYDDVDKQLVAALSVAGSPADTIDLLRRRLAALDTRISEIDGTFASKFPEFTALATPKPLSISEARGLLGKDEALVVFLDTNAHYTMEAETFVFIVTRDAQRWMRVNIGSEALAREIAAIRCGLDASAWLAAGSKCVELTGASYTSQDDRSGRPLPFDVRRAHALYKSLLGPADTVIEGKHLLIVASGSLTQLPFNVLVTDAPVRGADQGSGGAAWLARAHAITILPSVSSLKALRRNARASAATEPYLGLGNPSLSGDCGPPIIPDRCPQEASTLASAQHVPMVSRSAGVVAASSRYYRSGAGDVAALRQLCALPDTEHELTCVAKSLGAGRSSLKLGPDMSEREVKSLELSRYRIVHFATHGLLAGEMGQLSAAKAEPALVLTPPAVASENDDGLLTASEIAGLKLDADWVVMSACNTAAAGAESAEALSGLARAFFYAGARALLVSHWPVNSYAATMLTSRTFAELSKDRTIGRSEGLRRATVALMDDRDRPWAAHPSVWAPFIVVGEGGAR